MSAKALIIDTALSALSIGLFERIDGSVPRPIWSQSHSMMRGQEQALGEMIDEAMRHGGIDIKALDRIIVTLGPGSFTGVRIGLAHAKGLAIGAKIPLIGIGSLRAIALRDPYDTELVIAAIDTGRDQIAVQVFEKARALCEPYIFDFEQKNPFEGRSIVLTGPAAQRLSEYFKDAKIVPQASPDVASVARLGFEAEPPYLNTPYYMRDADAKASTKPVLVIKD